MSDQEVLDRALRAIGFDPEDESEAAQRARTWVDATFDDDAEWVETSDLGTIKREYECYRKLVYK